MPRWWRRAKGLVSKNIAMTRGLDRRPGKRGGRVCLEGTRTEPWYLVSCFLGGDSVEHIAKDYELTVAQVETAIRYELARAKRLKWAVDVHRATVVEGDHIE